MCFSSRQVDISENIAQHRPTVQNIPTVDIALFLQEGSGSGTVHKDSVDDLEKEDECPPKRLGPADEHFVELVDLVDDDEDECPPKRKVNWKANNKDRKVKLCFHVIALHAVHTSLFHFFCKR